MSGLGFTAGTRPTARGPVLRLAPATRLAVGLCAAGACLLVAADQAAGLLLTLTVLITWLGLVDLPGRAALRVGCVGLALALPLGLLALGFAPPPAAGAGPFPAALALPARWSFKAFALFAVLAATGAAVTRADAFDIVARLPAGLRALAGRLLWRTAWRADATAAHEAAYVVRAGLGPADHRLGRLWSWRSRAAVAPRARRAAAAAAARNFGGAGPRGEATPLARGDALALGLGFGLLAGSLLLGIGWLG